jgi:uncharacterized protein (TIGR04562 family)
MILHGLSVIDARTGFPIRNPEEAERFVEQYGFTLENPIEQSEVFGYFREAISFIQRHFLAPENPDGLKLQFPKRILEVKNVRDLLLYASMHFPGQSHDAPGLYLRDWACSVLKVMHTIAHLDQDPRASYFSDIQKQILDRFYRYIHRDESGGLYLGERPEDPYRVNLVAFESKPKKSRDSTLIKLLHKKENVAEELFDRVGVRFVTEDVLGALMVVRYLKAQMIVMTSNMKPSRSRNTLVDLEEFKKGCAEAHRALNAKEIEWEEFVKRMRSSAHPPPMDSSNPHSSEFYRSIQFTGRQLIKLQSPLYQDLRELKQLAKQESFPEGVQKILDRLDMKFVQREIRFFYPFEVQIVDQVSHEENEKGRSAHSEYKRAQLMTAMKRVMGNLVDVQTTTTFL